MDLNAWHARFLVQHAPDLQELVQPVLLDLGEMDGDVQEDLE